MMEKSTAELVVKVWAVLGWICAGFTALIALMMFGVGFLGGAGMFSAVSDLAGIDELTASIGAVGAQVLTIAFAVAGVILLIAAALGVFINIGLWKHKEWARIVTIVFSVLGVLSILSGNFLSAIFGGLGIWLFAFDPTVKGLFGEAPVASSPDKGVKKTAKK